MTTTTNGDWEPTRHGGLRRSYAVSSLAERHPDLVEDRKSRGTTDVGAIDLTDAATRTGFDSLTAYRWMKQNIIFKMNERLGLETCPYVIRWRFETPWGSIRLHHWLAPDDDRAKHDHPWSFVTFVLKGGYTDVGSCPTLCDNDCTANCHESHQVSWKRTHSESDHNEHLKAPAIRYRDAEHQHTVVPDEGGAWTVIVTGPKIRKWGFWVNGKFVKMNKYFLTYGHHPCD